MAFGGDHRRRRPRQRRQRLRGEPHRVDQDAPVLGGDRLRLDVEPPITLFETRQCQTPGTTLEASPAISGASLMTAY